MIKITCDHYEMSSLQPLWSVERWWLSMSDRIKCADMVTKTCPKSKKKVLVQNENRNQDVPLAKNLFKVNNRTPVQGMKSVKRYQQRHQNDIKTMLWWFYCQPQMLSTHSSNATFFYSKQTNAGNVNIV